MPHKRLTTGMSWGGGICRIAATFAGSGLTPPAVMMWPMKERCVFFSTAFLALSLNVLRFAAFFELLQVMGVSTFSIGHGVPTSSDQKVRNER